MQLNKKIIFFTFILFFIFSKGFSENIQDKNLLDVAKTNGITLYWDSFSNTGILEKNGQQVTFKTDQNFILLNSTKVVFADAPVISEGTVKVSSSFLNEIENFFQQENSDVPKMKIGAILIDPGHGGKDPGANMTHKINGKNVTLREKDINLTVCNMLSSMLSKA